MSTALADTALAEFIQLNMINEDVLYEALHKDILESILSEVCEYMKANESAYIAMKKIYFRNPNDIQAVKQIVQNVCHLSLSEQDLKWLNNCIKAYMKKKSHRKHIPDSLRRELWNRQERKCCICGKEIQINDGHVDHIVPWDYVGDELENNYHLLCSDCNLHKSNHIALALHALVFGKI